MKKVIIIGAGPAGITAANELLKDTKGEYDVTILEETERIGGISQTVRYNGNRMDIGGHRFFSKSDEVMNWWSELMPVQGKPSFDDKILGREKPLVENGPDPEKDDKVILVRDRVSRIYYNKHFFDYPVTMSAATIKNMGFLTTMKAGFSYLKSVMFKKPEDSLENFYINRFGKVLYSMFFEGYTEKLWGRHPSEISADWGSQRVKGLSIRAVLKDMFSKAFGGKKSSKEVETSLIEQFWYPKYGPGQLWEIATDRAIERGAKLLKNHSVKNIVCKDGKITAVVCNTPEGEKTIEGDIFVSSMPVKDLVAGMTGDEPSKEIKYMVEDPENTVWIGLEYFCAEGDDFWNLSDEECIKLATKELESMGVISSSEVLDSHREKIKKAYPAYFDTYAQMDELIKYLDTYTNLYCVGRNGQHRYNNMDHSMLTAIRAAEAIKAGKTDKGTIWNVNTEKEYHETK